MLMSLIAVLLLLVIGFYALFIGAVGRAASGEAPLALGRRLVMVLIGIGALTVAYLVYSNPGSLNSSASAPKSWNAMPSAPPETRGDLAAQTAASLGEPLEQDAAKPVAEPVASEPTPVVASSEGGNGISAAAAAMEAELLRRRQRLPALEAQKSDGDEEEEAETAAPTPAATPTVIADAPAPVARAESRSSTPPASSRPRSSSSNRRSTTSTRTLGVSRDSNYRPLLAPARPLTIVIQNELGERQQRETLALVIEGKRVASFEITDVTPVIELPVNLPRPGLLHYRLEGESLQGKRQSLRGQGCISATDGARFQVRRNPGSQKVFLESVSG